MDASIKTVPPRDAAEEGILWYMRSHGLGAGDRLPAERVLCEGIGVSRTALRSAIGTLVSNGILESRHGSGTYVRPAKPLNIFQDSYGFSDVARASGLEPGSRVVYKRLISADENLAGRFDLEIGAPLYEMRRVRLANGEPVMIETAFINYALCPGIEEFDFKDRSLYEVLGSVYGITIEHGDERVAITRLTEEEADLLDAKQGDPVFFERAHEFDGERRSVEYVKSLILPDRFRFASDGTEKGVPAPVEVGNAWLKL